MALSTRHRTREVHAGKGTRTGPREQGTHHPEEHANTEDPHRSKDATTRRALRKHRNARKSHCRTTRGTPPNSLARRAVRHRAVTGNRADTHKNSDTDGTDDTDALGSDTTKTCVEGDGCPWKEQQGQALLPLRKRLQLQTNQAVLRRFLERLARLLLVRLLET